jgi:Rrf2 family protein
MMLDLAQNYGQGAVKIGDVAKRQDISVKYLEQLIIPLKKAKLIKSVRGPKGGHLLAVPPEKITIGKIVQLLEPGSGLTGCVENPKTCPRADTCLTRAVWVEATEAMYQKLNSITLSQMVESGNQT